MISPEQSRAGRAWLGVSLREVEAATGVSLSEIGKFEIYYPQGLARRAEVAEKVEKFLSERGIHFSQSGIRGPKGKKKKQKEPTEAPEVPGPVVKKLSWGERR